MDHRVTVTICGNEYTFVAEEDGAYVEKVAAYVDQKMTEILSSTKAGHTDAAVLTAANIADELFKSQEIAENLRAQLKEYLDLLAEYKQQNDMNTQESEWIGEELDWASKMLSKISLL